MEQECKTTRKKTEKCFVDLNDFLVITDDHVHKINKSDMKLGLTFNICY